MAIQKKKTQDEKKQASTVRKANARSTRSTSSSSRKSSEETKKAASTTGTSKSSVSARTDARRSAAKAAKQQTAVTDTEMGTTSSSTAADQPKAKKTASTTRSTRSSAAKTVSAQTENKEERAEIVYQPEFEKSVLDQPGQHSGPVYRYSDAELQEFKELILKKLEAARQELAYLQGLITRKDEMGTEDTENKYMSMEDGSGTLEREQLNQMASRQIQYISHLEKALVRIENKTYGICRVTGKLIDKARLRAVPHATLSIEAKKALSKGS